MIELSVDGKNVQVEDGVSILEAARQAEVYIPKLCESEQLKRFGGCRLCIVEIEGRRGFPSSCTTPAENGMVVSTNTDKLRKLRKGVLELLLIEHPSACLVCNDRQVCYDSHEGTRKAEITTGCKFCPNFGRCELQRVVQSVFGQEGPVISMPTRYRDIAVDRRDPFIDRDDNLCILCGRCVRACEQISMANILDFGHRGIKARVGTAFNRTLVESGCRFCGECIDACPTGTLSERVRRWEGPAQSEVSTTCSFCSVGCQFDLGIRNDRVIESLPNKKSEVNKGDACVRGRFSVVEFVRSTDRIGRPLVRRNGVLTPVPWEVAIKAAVEGIKRTKPDRRALIYSSSCINETVYSAHKFARDALQTKHVDSSLRFSYGPVLESKGAIGQQASISDLEKAKAVLLVGSDVDFSHPVLAQKMKKAAKAGLTHLVTMGAGKQGLSRYAACEIQVQPGQEGQALDTLLLAIQGDAHDRETIDVEQASEVLNRAKNDGSVVIVFGSGLMRRLDGTANLTSICKLAALLSAKLLPLYSQANDRGALEIASCLSGGGLTAPEIVLAAQKGQIDLLYLIGEDLYPGNYSTQFVVVQDTFLPTEAGKIADVVFPVAAFTEIDGTYTNLEGRIQRVNKASDCWMVSQPDCEILARVANELKVPGFDFQGPANIMTEIAQNIPFFAGTNYSELSTNGAYFGKTQEGRTASTEKNTSQSVRSLNSERPDRDYPFQLMAVLDEFVFRSTPLASRVHGLRRIEPAGKVMINAKDAEAVGVETTMPVKLISRRGSATANAVVSEEVLPGTVKLVDRGADLFSVLMQQTLIEPESKIPEELCAVRIERL